MAWALPAFDADAALARMKRDLRELGLTERNGVFERRGLAIARASVEQGSLAAGRVKRPARSSPEWQNKRLKSSADVRDFVTDLKKNLALWSDLDD